MSWFSFVGEGVIAMKGYVRLGKRVEKQRTKAYKGIKIVVFERAYLLDGPMD